MSASLDGIRRPQTRNLHPTSATRPAPSLSRAKKRPTFRRLIQTASSLFLYALVGTYIYLLGAPFAPLAWGSIIHRSSPSTPSPTPVHLQSISQIDTHAATPTPIPGPNRLTIEGTGITGEVFEGADENTLNKGIWHRPNTSTPDKGSNTVLAAHRFQYLSNENSFYHLDVVKTGDRITLIWNGLAYHYTVKQTMVVTDRAIEIEQPTTEPTLTLYTCTPLWTSQNRLVVVATLD